MTATELKAAAIQHWGKKRWQKEVAAYLGCDVATVRRWTSGRTPIPGPVKAAMSPRALPPKETADAPDR